MDAIRKSLDIKNCFCGPDCPEELAITLSRFKKIRVEHIKGYRNLLPIAEATQRAAQYQQINLNTQFHYNAIVLDIDNEDLLTEWLEIGLPTPTIQTINKDNDKAHLVWLLKTPVWKEHRHATDYYFAIVDSLKELLAGADARYTNSSTKNFLNQDYFRVVYNDVSYELGDFKEFINPKFSSSKRTKNAFIEKDESFLFGFSRHLYMFEKLRFYGYRLSKDKSINLFAELSEIADEINSLFEEPINPKSIVKSIVSFCGKNSQNFSAAIRNKGIMKFEKIKYKSKEEFLKEKSIRQSLSAKRTTQIKRINTAKSIKLAILQLSRQKKETSIKNISHISGLSSSTIRRSTKLVKFFLQKKIVFIRYIRMIVTECSLLRPFYSQRHLLHLEPFTALNGKGNFT